MCCYSQPSEYGRVATTKLEQQARNAALSMMSAIIQRAANLMILAREKAEEVSSAEILNKSCVVNTLLPLVLAHISPLATIDSRVCAFSKQISNVICYYLSNLNIVLFWKYFQSAVYILSSIHQILPHTTALNLNNIQSIYNKNDGDLTNSTSGDIAELKVTTTSHHYTLVESDHPYKPATVNNYR